MHSVMKAMSDSVVTRIHLLTALYTSYVAMKWRYILVDVVMELWVKIMCKMI